MVNIEVFIQLTKKQSLRDGDWNKMVRNIILLNKKLLHEWTQAVQQGMD